MPKLSAWSIRLALVYLLLGFTWGAILLINKALALQPALWSLLPSHIEFLVLGWMVQLILGVAFWILPRFGMGTLRGNEKAAWASIILLNAGIFLVVLSPLMGSASPAGALIGRCFQAGSALAFGIHAWPRVKPSGKK